MRVWLVSSEDEDEGNAFGNREPKIWKERGALSDFMEQRYQAQDSITSGCYGEEKDFFCIVVFGSLCGEHLNSKVIDSPA